MTSGACGPLRWLRASLFQAAIHLKKSIIVAMFLSSCLVILTSLGCAESGQKEDASISGKLVFWNTMSGLEAQVMDEILNDFRKEHPNVRLTIEKVDFYHAKTKFKQAAKAGAAPDVFRADRFWVPVFVQEKLISPFSEREFKEYLSDLVATAKNVVKVEGKVYGIPHSIDCMCLMYNKQHFLEAKVEPPEDFDHFRTVAKKLTGL